MFSPQTTEDIWVSRASGDTPSLFLGTSFHLSTPRFSPDGQMDRLWLHEAAEYSGLPELFPRSSDAMERFRPIDVGGEFRFRRDAF